MSPATSDLNALHAADGRLRSSMWGTVKTFTQRKKIQITLGVVIFLLMIIAGLLFVSGLQASSSSGSVPSVNNNNNNNNNGDDSLTSDGGSDGGPVTGGAPAESPTASPAASRQAQIFKLLEDASSPNVRDTSTPAGMAAQWIVNEDMREVAANDDSLLQRFGLATLYFATGGVTSEDGGSWLDCSAIPEIKYSNQSLSTNGDAVCIYEGGRYLCAEVNDSENCTFVDDSTFAKVTSKRMLSPVSECDWYGIQCDTEFSVISVVVDGNELDGTLPPELVTVEKLELLSLRSNNIGGTLPPEWKDLKALRQVVLDDNELSGTIPVEWQGMVLLERLDLQDNNIMTVPLNPEFLRGVTNLKRLDLSSNEILAMGDIPSEIGVLQDLEYLSLDFVQVTGTLPTEIGLCKNLTHLSISDADMEGTIPSEIGQLEHLTMLSLLGSRYAGLIPEELYTINTLQFIKLERNRLEGTLSPSIGNLTELKLLILSQNEMTGSIPSELGTLVQMTSLILFHNHFTGSMPQEYCNGEIPNIGTLKADCLNGRLPLEKPAVSCPCCSVCCRNTVPQVCDDVPQ